MTTIKKNVTIKIIHLCGITININIIIINAKTDYKINSTNFVLLTTLTDEFSLLCKYTNTN